MCVKGLWSVLFRSRALDFLFSCSSLVSLKFYVAKNVHPSFMGPFDEKGK